MCGYDQAVVVNAFQQFLNSGAEFPPTLPEYRQVCDSLQKHDRMRQQTKQLEQKQTPEIAIYHKAVIRRILHDKGETMKMPEGYDSPLLTVEDIGAMRESLAQRGISVKPYSHFLAGKM